jgi:hypothetical protein
MVGIISVSVVEAGVEAGVVAASEDFDADDDDDDDAAAAAVETDSTAEEAEEEAEGVSEVPQTVATKLEMSPSSSSPEQALRTWEEMDGMRSLWLHTQGMSVKAHPVPLRAEMSGA